MKIKSMIICLSFFLTLLIGGVSAFAQTDINLIFESAARDYKEARYEQAIAGFKEILSAGVESGNIYYNLGNCYIKKGELAQAMLNYWRAQRLIPGDKDLQANYEYAKLLLKSKIETRPRIWILRVLDNLYQSFSLNRLTVFCFVLYLLLIAAIGISTVARISRWKLASSLAVLTVFLIISIFALSEQITGLDNQAIILAKEVDAKFEPFPKATDYFNLYEGMKVEVISSKDGWVKVRRQDGKSGWITKNNLEKI